MMLSGPKFGPDTILSASDALILILKVRVIDWFPPSVTRITVVKLPVADGVPLRTPLVAFMVRPVGAAVAFHV